MAITQNVSMTAPTDYSSEAAAIERRRKLAEALQAQGMQQQPTETVGGWAIPQGRMGMLSKLAQSLTGMYGQQQANQQEKGLASKYQSDLVNTVLASEKARLGTPAQTIPPDPQEAQQSADQGTPAVGPANVTAAPANTQLANALLMQHPATQSLGLQGMQQDMQRQQFMGMGAPAAAPGAPGVPGAPQATPTGFGAPAGGVPMAAWLQIDPTGKLYAQTLAKEQITPYQNAQLAQSDQHFKGVSGNTQATLGESQRHNTATEAQSGKTLAETTRHHAALEGDPKTVEETAQAIAAGKLAPLSGFALARPMAQNIMARVVQINPEYDPTQFQTRQKSEKDFATGKQGNSVRSFNVALSHLDTLDQLADALHNGNMQLVNKVGNAVATQTGSAAPTNFVAAKKIVADEIVKAIVGSGGGVTDREEAAKTIAAANSPAQLKGVINTYKELMRGQINGLRNQYESSTGKTDFDTKFLSQAGQAVEHATPNVGKTKSISWDSLK